MTWLPNSYDVIELRYGQVRDIPSNLREASLKTAEVLLFIYALLISASSFLSFTSVPTFVVAVILGLTYASLSVGLQLQREWAYYASLIFLGSFFIFRTVIFSILFLRGDGLDPSSDLADENLTNIMIVVDSSMHLFVMLLIYWGRTELNVRPLRVILKRAYYRISRHKEPTCHRCGSLNVTISDYGIGHCNSCGGIFSVNDKVAR